MLKGLLRVYARQAQLRLFLPALAFADPNCPAAQGFLFLLPKYLR